MREPVAMTFLCVLTLLLCSVSVQGAPKAPAFFVFGDSYADTGNRMRSGPYEGSGWKKPYGSTWPGHPAGRFGNGRIQTDLLADLIGLPLPPLYSEFQPDDSVVQSEHGINFAVGGSGVTYAWGFIPLGTQVDSFEILANMGIYSPEILASSVALVSEVGNDYASFVGNAMDLIGYAQQVVEGIKVNLQRLYNFGFRNIMVANLGRLDCVPGATKINNYTECIVPDLTAVLYHNQLLASAIAKLSSLPGARFLILDQYSAFTHVLNHPDSYGITQRLLPCCKGLTISDNCGDVDTEGTPLYTLCTSPEQHTFWDVAHPTQSTWKAVMRLYISSNASFVQGAPNLLLWLRSDALGTAPTASPTPTENRTGTAIAELGKAIQALVFQQNYSEVLGLLNSIDFEPYLRSRPEQPVTAFLPNNAAFLKNAYTKVDEIYCENQLYNVLKYHTTIGYHNESLLLKDRNQTLTTLSGMVLPVNVTGPSIRVGTSMLSAAVVDPDLYMEAGKVVVHGIDRLLAPPGVVSLNDRKLSPLLQI